MEHQNQEPNLLLNIAAFILSIVSFMDAHTTADEIRAWSSWLLGVTVSVLLIIINFPKAVEVLKNLFKK